MCIRDSINDQATLAPDLHLQPAIGNKYAAAAYDSSADRQYCDPTSFQTLTQLCGPLIFEVLDLEERRCDFLS
eukprot:3054933-Pyramimonas_sp.AAC.1